MFLYVLFTYIEEHVGACYRMTFCLLNFSVDAVAG